MTSTFAKSAFITSLLAVSLLVTAAPQPATAASSGPAGAAAAAASEPAADSSLPEEQSQDASDDAANWTDDDTRHSRRHSRRDHSDSHDMVSVGHDASLPAGSTMDSVVAVFGSATNDGTARQDVVSVFGDTTVNGPVAGSAVAVLGNVSVNADIGEDVVSVMGSIKLGPNAHVHGHVVSVMGAVTQDPAAIVDQGVERVLPEQFATAQGLRTWLGRGLMLGRPLLIGTGMQWLWGFALAFLAIYVILALLFREATEHCIATLEENPGKSFITATLAVLLTPLMLFLLAITVVGIAVIPIALVTLLCAAIFGKTTVLGWLGKRCVSAGPGLAAPHPALTVLLGGIIVMLAYLVPVLGLVVFILLGSLGYGAVLYALINRVRRSSSGSAVPAGGSGPDAPHVAAAATSAAAAAAAAAAQSSTAQRTGTDETVSPTDGPAMAASAAAPLPLSTYPRAGFWIRIAALFLDAIIICALLRLLLSLPDHHSARMCLLGLAAYGALMWKFKGTTIGGVVFDLRVVRLDSRPIDWPTACVRALGCILSICALGLGFIWIGIDADNQGWHDKLAGTIVVRVPKGTPLV